MRLRTTRTYFNLPLWLIGTILLINLSCNKDSDIFLDSILSEDSTEVTEQNANTSEPSEEVASTNEVNSTNTENIDEDESVELESRITLFPASNDAYFQNGLGYNLPINRLQENLRISYLMFDLRPIDSIGGVITSAHLEFTIHEDTGNGIIEVHKGATNSWSEDNLTAESAPEREVLLGSIEQEYQLNTKIKIDLNATEIIPEYTTLILTHKEGDDLAFASQENQNYEGPKLKVTYDSPVEAKEIVIEDNQAITEDSTTEEDITEQTEETTTEEETAAQEETTTEDTTEESTEEETTQDETTEEETAGEEGTAEESPVEEETNENGLPMAVVEATPQSGIVPLEVQFSGSGSIDDKAITKHEWDFKDGNVSSIANPSHTFTAVGTYNVSLTVYDAEGESSTTNVTINVLEKPNEAPNAVASASVYSGDAPLQVTFSGSNSTDDKEIVSYTWNIIGNTVTTPNSTNTFSVPGTYTISLTVADQEGLESTDSVTITVNEAPLPGCVNKGGMADESGLKTWCWEDINVPSGGPGNDNFSNGELVISAECNPGQVAKSGNQLKFSLNPTSPEPQGWCSNSYNMRAEIRTAPWKVNHPIGTEEWFGWSYTFGDNYIIDKVNPWAFFQVHEGTTGKTPMIALWCTSEDGAGGVSAGEIIVSNTTGGELYGTTGVRPQAGQTIDIVVRVVWGDETNGLLQIWIDGNKVHDVRRRTVHRFNPVGGNAKFGIYKWPWREAAGVQSSAQQGITELETYMGPLRIITRRPSDADYMTDSYLEVAPR